MRAFRQESHPLLLIGIWSSLEAANIAVIEILPGDPSYADSGMGSLGQAVVFTALVVFFVARGSRLAWWLAIFSTTVSFGIPIAMVLIDLSFKAFVLAPIAGAALWLIWSGSIETYVNSGRQSRTAQLH